MIPVTKPHPALKVDGQRTIHGYFHEGDIPLLAKAYPLIGEGVIRRIAQAINAPRLLEVATVLEVVHRYLEGAFSKIRGLAIQVVSNPLSILFWNDQKGCVQRIKTRESELMHGACEKLALRTDGVERINTILEDTFGLRLTFGCSCCAIVVGTGDAPALFASEYYRTRETFGRLFDSDVLCVTGDLLATDSVASVPPETLAASADFHEDEAMSYIRFARVCCEVVVQNPVTGRPLADQSVMRFLRGSDQLAA